MNGMKDPTDALMPRMIPSPRPMPTAFRPIPVNVAPMPQPRPEPIIAASVREEERRYTTGSDGTVAMVNSHGNKTSAVNANTSQMFS